MEDVINAVQNQQKEVLPENPLLLTFDDGYIDNFTFAFPLLEEFGFQGSFFIPGKTFRTHQLLDVNKIHYILAAADINLLVQDVFERLDYYRGAEYPIQSNEELFKQYAVANRFDSKETIFVKRILQTVLPEKLRNKISSDLFEKYVGISEEKLAYELYMNAEQIRMMKRHGMFIGLHGYDHYWLGNLPIDEMQSDVDNAIDALREFIDEKAWVMNFPYGSYNQDVVQYVKDKGAVLGLTTEVRIAEIGVDNRFTLPRLDCNDFPPKSERFREG
jgi:polysaccharide deacetylase est4A